MIVILIETLLFLSIALVSILLLRKALKKAKIDTIEEKANELKLEVVRVNKLNVEEYRANKRRVNNVIKKMED